VKEPAVRLCSDQRGPVRKKTAASPFEERPFRTSDVRAVYAWRSRCRDRRGGTGLIFATGRDAA
jgi:hypothetical protein